MTNMNIVVYDNGGKTLDRYTIVDLNSWRYDTEYKRRYDCISASTTGAGVFLHTDCNRGRHLGKKIQFSELSEELQKAVYRDYYIHFHYSVAFQISLLLSLTMKEVLIAIKLIESSGDTTIETAFKTGLGYVHTSVVLSKKVKEVWNETN